MKIEFLYSRQKVDIVNMRKTTRKFFSRNNFRAEERSWILLEKQVGSMLQCCFFLETKDGYLSKIFWLWNCSGPFIIQYVLTKYSRLYNLHFPNLLFFYLSFFSSSWISKSKKRAWYTVLPVDSVNGTVVSCFQHSSGFFCVDESLWMKIRKRRGLNRVWLGTKTALLWRVLNEIMKV